MLNASLLNLVGAKTRQSGNLPFRPFHSLKLGRGKLMKWPLLVLSVVLLATFALAQSAPTAQAQATPEPPQNVRVDSSQTTTTGLLFIWDAPSDVAGVDHYATQRKPSSQSDWTPSSNRGANLLSSGFLSLSPATSYDFRIRSCYDSAETNCSDWATATAKTLPEAPANLGLTPGGMALLANWDPVTGANGYKVQWKSGAEQYDPATRQATVTGGGTTSHIIRNLIVGTEYTVRVIATQTGGDDSAPSAEQRATPVPVGAAISATDPSPLTERTLDGAELTVDLAGTTYVSPLSPGQFSLQPQITGLSVASVQLESTTRATLTLAFTGDITFDRQLSVEVANAATSHSAALTTNPVTVTQAPRPEPVTNVSATGGPLSLDVVWNAVDNADGYVVEWKPTSEPNYDPADELEVDGGSTTSATIGGLLGNTQYDVRVYATSDFAADGPTTINSFARGTTLALGATISTTDPDPLTERTLDGAELTVDLAGTTYAPSLSPGQFSLMPPTTGPSISSVQRGSNTRATLTLAFTGNISADLDLSVEVANAATGLQTDLITNQVTVTRARAPAQVTGVALTPGPGSLEVSWTALADADGYGIQYLVTDQLTTLRQELVPGGSATQATLDGLLGETEYTVQVYATSNFAVDGDFSTPKTATTLEVTDPGVILFAIDHFSVLEGVPASYEIALHTEPLGNVVIKVRATGNSDGGRPR